MYVSTQDAEAGELTMFEASLGYNIRLTERERKKQGRKGERNKGKEEEREGVMCVFILVISLPQNASLQLSMVGHSCGPRTQEAEAEDCLKCKATQ